VVMGAAMQQGSTYMNVARQAALRAGLPTSVAGMSVDRQCGSGLMGIAIAAKQIICDGMTTTVGGGLESISLVQNEHANRYRTQDPWLVAHRNDVYMTMLETAEIVARRYGISRERQDEYALQSQQRTAAAQAAGRFDAEIVPLPTWKYVERKDDGSFSEEAVTLMKDEGNRADTTLAGLAALKGVLDAKSTITAGNSSQLSDGAGAVVVMDAREAERRNLQP